MPAIDPEDDRPKKKVVHEIGQDLSLLSSASWPSGLTCSKTRSAAWRLKRRESASQTAADAFFKK